MLKKDNKKNQILLHIAVYVCMVFAVCLCLSACGKKDDEQATVTDDGANSVDFEDTRATALDDGTYSVDFNTDSSMFHVNEACEGKGTLTVADGNMTLHISLPSKNIVNLYRGLAKEAEQDGAELLTPTTDTVTYSDGMTEEVNGFDVPVPVLDEEFDLALLGTKGKWYDHKVVVSNPAPIKNDTKEDTSTKDETTQDKVTKDDKAEIVLSELADGKYTVGVSMEGGSGRAGIASPAVLTVEDGTAVARIEWSSPYYDYMVVNGEKLEPINSDGNSIFEMTVEALNEPIAVIADTTAMSKPHEIEYIFTFDSGTLNRE